MVAALCEAAEPGTVLPAVDGHLADPNGYLNIAGSGVLIKLEPPGHIKAVDLDGRYPQGTTPPLPDDQQYL